MRKGLLITILILISTVYCKSQQPIKSDVKFKLEASHIDSLNKYRSLGRVTFNIADTIVEITEAKDYYVERKTIRGSAFSTGYRYYKGSLSLKSSVTLFYNTPVGIFKEYDKDGIMINQIDNDEPYKFTIKNLIDKMATTYQVDLLSPMKNADVRRYIEDVTNTPKYEIRIPFDGQFFQYIVLNGDSGETIIDKMGHYEE